MRRRGQGDKPSDETMAYIAILKQDPCCFCGEPMEEIEHIEPPARWDLRVPGWNQWTNLSAACQKCNGQKYEKSLLAFLLN